MLILGDCLEKLKELPDNSIDSLVTDPPAGIGFMGKEWDDFRRQRNPNDAERESVFGRTSRTGPEYGRGDRDNFIHFMTDVMVECYRVMKPGAHGLVWAIPRTSYWTAFALDEAGFEVRDVVTHLFGSGFPKSLNVSKAIDKEAGAEREVLGYVPHTTGIQRNNSLQRDELDGGDSRQGKLAHDMMPVTAPSTDDAKKWEGWGTALKPASEHWILVRKPCSEDTVAANVIKWGVGALNIDGSRIETGDNLNGGAYAKNPTPRTGTWVQDRKGDSKVFEAGGAGDYQQPTGRWPANLVLSHSEDCTEDQCALDCAAGMLDKQSLAGGMHDAGKARSHGAYSKSGMFSSAATGAGHRLGDSGGASRFFYCAKAPKTEKNAGCDMGVAQSAGARPNSADMSGKFPDHDQRPRVGNFHPTVKPLKLMRYFCKLITPPGGTTLDPFMGSGSTGCAALQEGFKFIGIERNADYFEIAKKRMENVL